MAQFTRLAAAIAAATLAGAVHAAPTVEFSGEVAFEASYTDADASGSSSQVVIDTVDLSATATEGAWKAGFTLDAAGNVALDNAFLEYKINNNYTAFAKHDDTLVGLQMATAKWNDTLNDTLVDHNGATMSGVKIAGGPISSTIYVTNGPNNEDDLEEFGTSVNFEQDMFTAHFGFVSEAAVNTASPIGAFSLGGTASIDAITLVAEYNWLSDSIGGQDPTFLHVEANYEMEGYTFIASFENTDEAAALESVEDRIALGVNKDITDMVWVSGELDIDSTYAGNDDVTLAVAIGASF